MRLPPKSISNINITTPAGSSGDPPSSARLSELLEEAMSELGEPTSERTLLAKTGQNSVIASGADEGLDTSNTRDVFREHGPRLLKKALWGTGASPESEDLVQEALIRREKHLAKGKAIHNETAFLNTVLRNLVIDFHRRRLRWTSRNVDLDEEELPSVCDDVVDPDEELWAAVDTLPEIQHDILYMSFMDGMSGNEIAEALKTSPKIVSRLKMRALNELRNILGDQG